MLTMKAAPNQTAPSLSPEQTDRLSGIKDNIDVLRMALEQSVTPAPPALVHALVHLVEADMWLERALKLNGAPARR